MLQRWKPPDCLPCESVHCRPPGSTTVEMTTSAMTETEQGTAADIPGAACPFLCGWTEMAWLHLFAGEANCYHCGNTARFCLLFPGICTCVQVNKAEKERTVKPFPACQALGSWSALCHGEHCVTHMLRCFTWTVRFINVDI